MASAHSIEGCQAEEKRMLKAGRVRVAGAMSGTSLDGVDVAVIQSDGDRLLGIGETRFHSYDTDQRAVLRAALGKWPGADLARAAEIVETVHAQALSGLDGVTLAGFHGQTLAHDPRGRGTHQLGDGAVLAEVLGLPVVWDFRSADVRMGGEGAPLAPFYHFALAGRPMPRSTT
jgi:anhydro-N-acetylmuramic acid kinase